MSLRKLTKTVLSFSLTFSISLGAGVHQHQGKLIVRKPMCYGKFGAFEGEKSVSEKGVTSRMMATPGGNLLVSLCNN